MLNDPSAAIPFNSNHNFKMTFPQESHEFIGKDLLNQNSALADMPENPSNGNLQFQKNVFPTND